MSTNTNNNPANQQQQQQLSSWSTAGRKAAKRSDRSSWRTDPNDKKTSGESASTRGGAGAGARTLVSLTAENLAVLSLNASPTTHDPLNNDMLAHFGKTNSYQNSVASSLTSFLETIHAQNRMIERKVTKEEISRVIKKGTTESLRDGKFAVALDDLVVVLGFELFTNFRSLAINNSSGEAVTDFDIDGDSTTRDSWRQSASTKKIVTVYRRVAFEGSNVHTDYRFTDKMMSTWWKLYQHISSTLPQTDLGQEVPTTVEEPSWREFEVMLEDARICHEAGTLQKVLDWVIPIKNSNPNFGFANSFEITLLARACVYGFPNLVRLLRRYGANPCQRNTYARHRCNPLQSMFTLDRLAHIPWRTSEKDVETIQALLGAPSPSAAVSCLSPEEQDKMSRTQSQCINGMYRRSSTFKRAVFFGDQAIIDCLLRYPSVNVAIHDKEDEPISLVALYGGLRISLPLDLAKEEAIEVFYPRLQRIPEGYSVLPANEIPKTFKLRLASSTLPNQILGTKSYPDTSGNLSPEAYVLKNLIDCETDNCEPQPALDPPLPRPLGWSEAILSTDQPSNLWGLSPAIEQQWVRIYRKTNNSSSTRCSRLNALSHFPKVNEDMIRARPYTACAKGFGLWAPCTNTSKGHLSAFRFYYLPTASDVCSRFVIIGQSLNERDQREQEQGQQEQEHQQDSVNDLALDRGSFLCYMDEMLVFREGCHPSEATVFELIPVVLN